MKINTGHVFGVRDSKAREDILGTEGRIRLMGWVGCSPATSQAWQAYGVRLMGSEREVSELFIPLEAKAPGLLMQAIRIQYLSILILFSVLMGYSFRGGL